MPHASVSWLIICMRFSRWNIICFGQKEPIKVQFFRFLSALMKVHTTPHSIFETARSGFIHILVDCPVSWKMPPLHFFSSDYFGQKELIKKKLSDFWLVGLNFAKFFMPYLKSQVGFSLNFASLISVMRDKSSVLF